MGEGFIVRRGGGGQQTVKPIYNSLTEVGFTSLTLNVTNDSGSIATLYYSVVNTEPAPNQVGTFETEFAGKETKNITITGLTSGTTYTVYIKAAAVGEFPSETVSVPNLTTGVAMNATGGTIEEYNLTNSPTKRYRSHTFTGNGTFQVTQLSNMGSTFNQVDYLIVAGGGGGGSTIGGGGGAGGYRTTVGLTGGNAAAEPKVSVTTTSYSIVVGAGGGGAAGSSSNRGVQAALGLNSSALNITSIGGGNGASYDRVARTGGSGGGGASAASTGVSGLAGTAGQGFGGGNGVSNVGAGSVGAGGGGAAGAGPNGSTNNGSTGAGAGIARTNIIRNGSTAVAYAGGGNGGGHSNGALGGKGGPQLTVPWQNTGNPDGSNGTVNTGSGGGGGSYNGNQSPTDRPGGAGGSGIVVIRYEIAPSV
jgi:hypothetical protein